jgi:hypothetical protein
LRCCPSCSNASWRRKPFATSRKRSGSGAGTHRRRSRRQDSLAQGSRALGRTGFAEPHHPLPRHRIHPPYLCILVEELQHFATTVNHKQKENVYNDAYTNTSEGYFSILKGGIYGTYRNVSAMHLHHHYLAELDFRYNQSVVLTIADPGRTEAALRGIIGKHLTHQGS